ncbi:MAG: ribonuclease PH [Anaerolineae bacterium]|nr:MAG: ribonuclease PH [Anaerolineae bacterium]
MRRVDGRRADELRAVTIAPDYVTYPEGSVLISMGETKVLCNVSVEEGVPGWMRAQGVEGGWVTAEYALLPRSTHRRTPRETSGPRGRTQEIRRLIGRSLRAAVNLEKLGERTCIVDCDVIQADGGTRTAAVTGGYVALATALGKLIRGGLLPPEVLKAAVAAVSVGVVGGQPVLDLCYEEDSTAEVDVNVVMNATGEFIEVQGTAEGRPFSRQTMDQLIDLAAQGIRQLLETERSVLEKEARA